MAIPPSRPMRDSARPSRLVIGVGHLLENRCAQRWIGAHMLHGCYRVAQQGRARVRLPRAPSEETNMVDPLVPLALGDRTVLIAPVDTMGGRVEVGRVPYTLR